MDSPNSEGKIKRLKRKDEERRAREKAEVYNLPYVNLALTPVQYDALRTVPKETAMKAGIAVIKRRENTVRVAVENPNQEEAREVIQQLKERFDKVNVALTSRSGLEEAWKNYTKEAEESEAITGHTEISPKTLKRFQKNIVTIEDIQNELNELEESDASSVFELFLSSAIALDATDIHIEPREEHTVVRIRIDGILYDAAEIDKRLYELIISRVKLLSGLKLNIHDTPQEGSFSIAFEDREIEIRSSILPGAYNEDIALRILDPRFLLSLNELGLREDLEKEFKKHIKQPQGFILVTGPTGSGKTTTLYAAIKHLAGAKTKIVTIEDPIEYRLENITQTQVNIDKGYSYESGLKAILRQDPDVVLLSELRGVEASRAALQAALAGRMVFSTLHTIDSAGTAPRLIDLGADPSSVSSALSASIAQRLVRRLCEECKKKKKLKEEEVKELKALMRSWPRDLSHPPITKETKVFKPKKDGCEACRGTGYKGRIAIFEFFVPSDDIREKIRNNATEEELRDAAIKEGMTTLQHDAVVKILEGITSIKEMKRVLGDDLAKQQEKENEDENSSNNNQQKNAL